MRAVVWHGVGDIRIDDLPDPKVQEPTDAVVRLTASAICGTDLHFVRGTMAGMREGTILGHEGVGVVTETGPGVRNLRPGDRVVIPSTIGCGSCSYCRAGYFAQCDVANPNGPLAGTAFFGGPEPTGPFDGMQAELVRVPFANVGPVKLPDEVTDDQAIMFQGAGRVLAVDGEPSRLDAARRQGAETIDFNAEDPVQALRELTGGSGPDRVIDAVGVDAKAPQAGPAADEASDNPSAQALRWAVDGVAKAGTVGIIGVYPPQFEQFPIGLAMNKNLTLKMGNCNHRRYLPDLVTMTRAGAVDPSNVLTQVSDVGDAIEAYQAFDREDPGWIKVALDPSS
jgi:threonine dehydrogenase-like Zn-dependent dehydrogenase